MDYGYMLGYWKAGPPAGALDAVQEAERLGFDSVWTAEAYGSDAFTPLAWWGAQTSTIKLATGIAQLSARTPASTAMTAMTLDHLSGGRVILGLGVSGPQVVEGWYGQRFPKPLARTREYVAILRSVMAREALVEAPGPQLPLPRTGEGTTGLGKPLISTLHPLRPHIPIHLAAEGPRNTALAAEIADGWLPFLFSPDRDAEARALLAEGFAKRDAALPSAEAFEVSVPVPIVVDNDLEVAADRLRPMIALYVGGMGAKGANFHFDAVARLGFEAECLEIQEHYLAGRKADAIAAVPMRLIDEIALVGPAARIRDGLERWEESVVTRMLVQGDVRALRAIAQLRG
ncbi:LLM class F420-dependent oxidoreductase [Agrococcus sp. ProA11]|uniref:LLM class F420-dependent oxidoreductase n=1 Tax=Agrococcus chionoecetis TaxID=3153752 RepID=UPI0032610821